MNAQLGYELQHTKCKFSLYEAIFTEKKTEIENKVNPDLKAVGYVKTYFISSLDS